MNELLTINDFCRLLNISRATFYNWKKEGKAPPFIKVKGKILFQKGDLERWIKKYKRINNEN